MTVRGKGSDAVLHETVLSQLDLITQIKQARRPTPEKTILDDNFGVVKPGEMLLVLARPGGGATTLLRVLSNQRGGFSAIEGDVKFGTMDSKQAAEYHGQIVMNGEEVCEVLSFINKQHNELTFLAHAPPCVLRIGNLLPIHDRRANADVCNSTQGTIVPA